MKSHNNLIQIRCLLEFSQSTNEIHNQKIGTIPVGYRPALDTIIPAFCYLHPKHNIGTTATSGYFYIKSNTGDISINSGSLSINFAWTTGMFFQHK